MLSTRFAIAAALLLAFTASAPAETRYAGGPKTGWLVQTGHGMPAAATAATRGLDARAEMTAPDTPAPKGGISARGL